MTSNLGAEYLVNQPEGQDTDVVREEVMSVVRSHFRPEFLNRVDEIILFHRLKRSEMGAIVDIQITRLQTLLDERKITLAFDPEARAWLAEKGYDPAYGARPLKRVIRRRPRRRGRGTRRSAARPRSARRSRPSACTAPPAWPAARRGPVSWPARRPGRPPHGPRPPPAAASATGRRRRRPGRRRPARRTPAAGS